ncbi:MAG: thymidine phosphorylase [Deltaproteobacteria bacterium RIFCSPHIGHO2_12_FULL_43_9]|nr:MAG: thymidine phosphorylase [Deltaproteobacteria bacterium RIFCSPHIGHO2_12_FULL_43_9]
MSFLSLIEKKRDGGEFNREEISYFLKAATKNLVPDYQISALLMAIYFRGMSSEETAILTDEMVNSGIRFDFKDISGIKVDKHSTGGVGDKISLIVGPLVAAAGIPVPMVSGRALGHTGGTLDKLESIPGFRTELTFKEAKNLLRTNNIFFIGQTDELSPADRKLYALRDVTGTVESLPLITGSIMSKKIAEGIDALILDVKVGSGSFMKTMERARELANMLVDTGEKNGVRTEALITDMSQPLGKNIGNGLEVWEAIDTLKGNGPADTHYLSLEIAGRMLRLGGKASTNEEGRKKVEHILNQGLGLKKFRDIIASQGGDASVIENPEVLCRGVEQLEVKSSGPGFVSEIDCFRTGKLANRLGAGRSSLEEKIDPRVGIVFHKKVGDKVSIGESVVTLYVSSKTGKEEMAKDALRLFKLSSSRVQSPKLIIEEIKNG